MLKTPVEWCLVPTSPLCSGCAQMGYQPAEIRAVLLADTKTCARLSKCLEPAAMEDSFDAVAKRLGLGPNIVVPAEAPAGSGQPIQRSLGTPLRRHIYLKHVTLSLYFQSGTMETHQHDIDNHSQAYVLLPALHAFFQNICYFPLVYAPNSESLQTHYEAHYGTHSETTVSHLKNRGPWNTSLQRR